MNAITITGNLGRDPETFEYGQEGRRAVRLTVANTEDRKGPRERTSWLTVVCFGPLGDNVVKSLHKGDHIIATGEMSGRSWQDPVTQEWQSRYQLIAQEVGLSLNFISLKVTETPQEPVAPPLVAEEAPTPPPAPKARGGRKPKSAAPAAENAADEKPF
jgi:single-strand DNA-binding protein